MLVRVVGSRAILTLLLIVMLTVMGFSFEPNAQSSPPLFPPSHAWVPRLPAKNGISPSEFESRLTAANNVSVGIADFGVNSSVGYQYETNESLGVIELDSLSTRNATGGSSMGFQLNVNLAFQNDHQLYVYWVQDVVEIDTSTDLAHFIDNVWNFSSASAGMNGADIKGGGQVQLYNGTGFYYDVASEVGSNGLHLPTPCTISLLVGTQLNNPGQPTVEFSYSTGSSFTTFDTVTFAAANNVTSSPAFEVNGNFFNPHGLFYDSELVMGGPGGGSSTSDVSSDVKLALYWWNGYNFQSVLNAFNFGGDTGETIANADSAAYYSEGNGNLFAWVQSGTTKLQELYTHQQIGTFLISGGIGCTPGCSWSLDITNSSQPNAVPYHTDFFGSRVEVSVYPGTYFLQVRAKGERSEQGNLTVGPGQTVQISGPFGPAAFTMNYAVVGGQMGFPPPIFTYVHEGLTRHAILSTSYETYYLDMGTNYTISGNYTSGLERWLMPHCNKVLPCYPPGEPGWFQSGTVFDRVTGWTSVFYHQVLVSFSSNIVGGGSLPSVPVHYISFGISKETGLGSPVWADVGGTFSSPSILGASAGVRWASHSTKGIVRQAGGVTLTYYHQVGIELRFAVAGGGPYGVPTLLGTMFGGTHNVTVANATICYLDYGTTWSLQDLLQGSGPNERWVAQNANETVTEPLNATFRYYHQVGINIGYVILGGGGSHSPPSLRGMALGNKFATILTNETTYFLDYGSQWSLQSQLQGSGSTERWISFQPLNESAFSPGSFAAVYHHQYKVTINAVPNSGGTTTISSSWVDASSTIAVGANSTQGWHFEGWTGKGNGSYTGMQVVASISADAPIIENATFYPEVTLSAGTNGGVSYSYGSHEGLVPSGTSVNLFVPQGTNIMLEAIPSSLLYIFSGWSTRLGGPATAITVTTPTSAAASFSLNLTLIIGAVGAATVIIAAAAIYLRKWNSHQLHLLQTSLLEL